MKSSYIDYSMSVIVSRALPDVRDGLKPVQRRVLYGMSELGVTSGKPFKKSARIVGEVLGKYHPHGDSSVYMAMVRMAQSWSLRYPLVDGQGNFGSVDGDSPAAMRYTEARLMKVTEDTLVDLDKDTVDMIPNFDESLKEPSVLPTRIPLLLVNGASGIAVGMATNMPPHNLRDTIDAICAYIDDRDIEIDDLIRIIKAPDFPTGGTIYGYAGVKEAYHTGRGRVVVRSKTSVETTPHGREKLIVHEIPYMVNKAELISRIADLVNEKKIDGIILPVSAATDELIEILLYNHFPFIVLGEPDNVREGIHWIDMDNKQGAEDAVTYLYQAGYKKTILLVENRITMFERKRIQGFQSAIALMNKDIAENFIVECGTESIQIGDALKNAFDKCADIDSIICTNNVVAYETLKFLRKEKKKVPHNIGIITFDNYPLAEYMDPSLTVVDIDTYKLGEEAANTLFSIIQDPNQDRKEVLLPTRIIERESTMKGENRKK